MTSDITQGDFVTSLSSDDALRFYNFCFQFLYVWLTWTLGNNGLDFLILTKRRILFGWVGY